ncbi:hypothetical protein MtrunA17_Chr7g0273561 [Medicago truncatula]|uniref:Uncharacterized protein n=1 Tax=Medicago truncatula TaxID=3880 RepID=G7L0Q8_MEDTR|nr:hypothetical protein MTR_7g114230 [Medicago truncatula]RHN49349.1 hypothetical protein MtrunA17_Chr7g0273561 [Medicago truncatula]
MRGARGPSTSRLDQPHKQERHHTLTQNLKASTSFSSCSPFKRKLLLACIVVAGFSANGPTLLAPPLLLSTQTDRLPRSHHSSNGALIPLLDHEGSSGTVYIEARTTTLVRETPHSYPKP